MAEPTTSDDARTDEDGRRRRPWARRAGGLVLVAALGLAGAWLAVLVAGTERQPVGPFDTTMALQPATHGGTTVQMPPLGQLMLDTHDAPLRLRVRVEGIDAAEARQIAANPQRLTGLKDRAVSDVRSGLVDVFVRTAVVALAGGVGLALLVVRRVRAAVLAGSVAAAATAAGYYLTWSTWNPQAIHEPRYTGLLTSAPSVVGNARDIVQDFSKYSDQLARLVTNVSSLYSATSTLPVMAEQEKELVRVLHVSDLHLAPQAWDVIATVAHQYEVDVVVDSGDITDHGSRAENRYLEGVRRLGVPYVWVRGNHDSMVTQRAMQRLPQVTVLNGKPREVAGLRFLGGGDPRFTPDQSEPVAEQAVVTQAHALADVARRDGRVDLVVYHDPEPARAFDGLASAVLSGHRHMHRRDLMPEGTWRLMEGSTGGSGLRALEPKDGPAPIQLSVLYLDRDTAELRAWDHLKLGGLGLTSAQINREVVEPGQEPVSELEFPTVQEPVPQTPLKQPTVTGTFPTPTASPEELAPAEPTDGPTAEPSPTEPTAEATGEATGERGGDR